MARYQHLPLFKSVYDLNLYFFKLSRGFPKDFKYGSSFLAHFSFANSFSLQKDWRFPCLDTFISKTILK